MTPPNKFSVQRMEAGDTEFQTRAHAARRHRSPYCGGVIGVSHNISRQMDMSVIPLLVALTATGVAWPAFAAEQSPITSSEVSTNHGPEAVMAARNRGQETATKDIKAGEVRVLYFGKPWSPGKPLVDETTGYRVQIVGGCVVSEPFVAEVEAYNKAMRDWYAKTKKAPNAHAQPCPFRHAVFVSSGHAVTGTFALNFTFTNVSTSTLNPKTLIEESSLKVNGKEVADWQLTIRNGPRDSRWTSLPPGDHVEFGYAMGAPDFRAPGVYNVVWVVQGQATKPFRVEAKESPYRVSAYVFDTEARFKMYKAAGECVGNPQICEKLFARPMAYDGHDVPIPKGATSFGVVVVTNGKECGIIPLFTWADVSGKKHCACNGPTPWFARSEESQEKLLSSIIDALKEK